MAVRLKEAGVSWELVYEVSRVVAPVFTIMLAVVWIVDYRRRRGEKPINPEE